MISLNNWIDSSGKYPERAKSFELNAGVIRNAKSLLIRVNALLQRLKINGAVVSSGFRPSDVNKALPNSAKRSAHMSGEAIDLEDKDGDLDALITVELLKEFDLYREDSNYTKGWTHLQSRPTTSGKRVFIP